MAETGISANLGTHSGYSFYNAHSKHRAVIDGDQGMKTMAIDI